MDGKRSPTHPVLNAPILLLMPDRPPMGGCPPDPLPPPPIGWCGEAGTLPPMPPMPPTPTVPSAALRAEKAAPITGLLEMGERGRCRAG